MNKPGSKRRFMRSAIILEVLVAEDVVKQLILKHFVYSPEHYNLFQAKLIEMCFHMKLYLMK